MGRGKTIPSVPCIHANDDIAADTRETPSAAFKTIGLPLSGLVETGMRSGWTVEFGIVIRFVANAERCGKNIPTRVVSNESPGHWIAIDTPCNVSPSRQKETRISMGDPSVPIMKEEMNHRSQDHRDELAGNRRDLREHTTNSPLVTSLSQLHSYLQIA